MDYQNVICIDGTSGVGKGTLAKNLAKVINAQILFSGSIYRAAALHLIAQGIDLNIEEISSEQAQEYASLIEDLPLEFKKVDQDYKIILDKKDVTEQIGLETIGAYASKIASHNIIRQVLLQRQKDYANIDGILIAEGRDMGTNIFPTAKYKFYLDASLEVKAQRRYDELVQNGVITNFATVLEQIRTRDINDKKNAKPASDAIIIDTSNLDRQQVLAVVLDCLNK